jgi:uncharacterized protein YbaP (TraB family)
MKKSFSIQLLIIVALCCGLSVSAQNKDQHKKNSLLWKISKTNSPYTSYLFGTVHIICKDDYIWTDAMQQCFKKSKQLCLEVNLSDPNMITETAGLLIDFSGTSLKDYFKKESDYQLVAHYISDSLQQNIEVYEHIKPIGLYLLYSNSAARSGCANSESYEMNLLDKARSASMHIEGLESMQDQIDALESIPTDSIINQMIQIATGVQKEEIDIFEQLISNYKKQDIEMLNSIMLASMKNGLDAHQFIDKRNQNWIPPMQRFMEKGSTFFAVGAGHIKGLIELLRAKGYSVEAIH